MSKAATTLMGSRKVENGNQIYSVEQQSELMTEMFTTANSSGSVFRKLAQKWGHKYTGVKQLWYRICRCRGAYKDEDLHEDVRCLIRLERLNVHTHRFIRSQLAYAPKHLKTLEMLAQRLNCDSQLIRPWM